MLHIQQDIHIHTSLSSCAQEDATVENYLGRAKEDGLTLLGFSNHLWDQDVPGASNWYRPQNVEHVLALKETLPALAQQSGIRLLFGCETEFTYEGKLCLTEEHMALFDYILVPHSHTHMKIVMPTELGDTPEKHAKFLMDSFMRLVNHPLAHRITAIAHPFVPGTNYAIYNDIQSRIPDSYLREAFTAAREKGIAIELNGSCLTYLPDKEVLCCEYVRIYTIAKECGCRFSYGSDSHSCRTNRKLPLIEAFLSQCGITDEDFIRF